MTLFLSVAKSPEFRLSIVLLQYFFTLCLTDEEQNWDRASWRWEEVATAFLADGTNTLCASIRTHTHTRSPAQTMMENLSGVQRSHLTVLTSQDLHNYHEAAQINHARLYCSRLLANNAWEEAELSFFFSGTGAGHARAGNSSPAAHVGFTELLTSGRAAHPSAVGLHTYKGKMWKLNCKFQFAELHSMF